MQLFLVQNNFVAGASKKDKIKFSEVQLFFQKEAMVACVLPYVVSISDEKNRDEILIRNMNKANIFNVSDRLCSSFSIRTD